MIAASRHPILRFISGFPGIGRNLGIAIANPSPTTNYVTLTLRDETGTVAGTAVTVALQPEEQLAKFVSELLPSAAGVAFSRNSEAPKLDAIRGARIAFRRQ